MYKTILTIICIFQFLAENKSIAQNYQWAFTTGKEQRTEVAAIREDHTGDFYLATITGIAGAPEYSQIDKYDLDHQLLWQKRITGNVIITDIEINPGDHSIVTGYFEGTISIDGNTLISIPFASSGFIFEADETGLVLWAHSLNPINDSFRPLDLFIAPNGLMYLTSELGGINPGFCAFHKLNAQGDIIQNEFNDNSEDRTFSHIIADEAGNVYLSGTCGNFATFDTIHSNPDYPYQNFLVKYDSNFKAQWLISKNYITFDNNNRLGNYNQNLFWAINDFEGNSSDTVKIIKINYEGQFISSVAGPLSIAFFPGIDYSIDHQGNSTLVIESFARLFVYRYDNENNIIWQDTLMTQSSGFPLKTGLICTDSGFYLSSIYLNDTLKVDNFILINPNAGMNYPSDIFVCKWGYNQTTAINNPFVRDENSIVFPNPASCSISLNAKENDLILIADATGRTVYSGFYHGNINVSRLKNGIYYVTIASEENRTKAVLKIAISN
jgi:hypothetical protein